MRVDPSGRQGLPYQNVPFAGQYFGSEVRGYRDMARDTLSQVTKSQYQSGHYRLTRRAGVWLCSGMGSVYSATHRYKRGLVAPDS